MTLAGNHSKCKLFFLNNYQITEVGKDTTKTLNGFQGGHLLVVEASGPDVDQATVSCHLPIVCDLTGPAKRRNPPPPPGSNSWEFITGVYSCFYNRSTTPLKLSETDWGGDPPPRLGMRERKKRLTKPCMMGDNCSIGALKYPILKYWTPSIH